MPSRPSEIILKKAQRTIIDRFEASNKIVVSKKDAWERYEKLRDSEQQAAKFNYESNLVIPKPDYIIETITPKIMNTIFSIPEWITVKSAVPDEITRKVQQVLLWVFDKKINFYLSALELFKAAPIYGTSFCKVYLKDYWPVIEYIPPDKFYPDANVNKPGQIDEMRYCFHEFDRDIIQLRNMKVSGQPLYFDLEKLEEENANEGIKMAGVDTTVDDKTKIHRLCEYWGELEVDGEIKEYVITASLKGDVPSTIIRCEPSGMKYTDQYTKQVKYIKPFVSSLYSITPGEFYGRGAIQSIESLTNEQNELHNLYMDNHKRLVNGIVKVNNRSNLTEDDLQFKPGGIWWLDNMDDVDVVTYPEINMAAYTVIHQMLSREIEKASGVNDPSTGVGSTKRQTLGEFSGLQTEHNERFKVFIQMADRLTLRPITFRVLLLLQQSMKLLNNPLFDIGSEQIQLHEEDLLTPMDFTFAATAVETEHSKYSKQQMFPRVLKELIGLAEVAQDGKLNMKEIVKEMGELFNIKNPERFVTTETMIPLGILPPHLQQTVMEAMQAAQMAMEEQARQQKKGQGGSQGGGQRRVEGQGQRKLPSGS